MIRTRFAPSPTGFMHIGNLRTALYGYLLAKSTNGKFILRLEDTDKERFVEGATEVIYKSLENSGIKCDESPEIGGKYAPYIQSERKAIYIKHALQLVAEKKAYYCFCTKQELEKNVISNEFGKYNRHCYNLSKEEIENKLKNNTPYAIRQLIPEGTTTIYDEIFGEITVNNNELEDQVLLKSDSLPTYNFANVVDDYLMKITHVIRGTEYLSSAPKYNLLYDAFKWEIPKYIHLPLILNEKGEKLSKRKGDFTFNDLLEEGYLPKAIINYIALLGWSPETNQEIFSLEELSKSFKLEGISKSPACFDKVKLNWINSEYIKKLTHEEFYKIAYPHLKENIKREDIDLEKIAKVVQTRITLPREIGELINFIDTLPDYVKDLYVHKKMKTTEEISKNSLKKILPILKNITDWNENTLHEFIFKQIEELEIKNSQMLWPIRTALSGKPSSPCGAIELAFLLGKKDTISRIEKGIEMLS